MLGCHLQDHDHNFNLKANAAGFTANSQSHNAAAPSHAAFGSLCFLLMWLLPACAGCWQC